MLANVSCKSLVLASSNLFDRLGLVISFTHLCGVRRCARMCEKRRAASGVLVSESSLGSLMWLSWFAYFTWLFSVGAPLMRSAVY